MAFHPLLPLDTANTSTSRGPGLNFFLTVTSLIFDVIRMPKHSGFFFFSPSRGLLNPIKKEKAVDFTEAGQPPITAFLLLGSIL